MSESEHHSDLKQGATGCRRVTVTDIRLDGYDFDPLHGILEGSWYAF